MAKQFTREELLGAYRTMRMIRAFEDRVRRPVRRSNVRGAATGRA
jgi:TPP-dependent pyruvate/acetoin dehydrogenase alpha subunit